MLIVETGTGIANANAYIDRTYADAFFAARGLDEILYAYAGERTEPLQAWVGTPEQKDGAIIRATDHIDAVYATHFLGEPESPFQPLAWPRTGFSTLGQVLLPPALKKATALYALRALQGTLLPQQASVPTETTDVEVSSGIKRKKEKVGPLEEEIEYETGAAAPKQSQILYFHEVLTPASYPEADLMLQSLLRVESRQSPTHPQTPQQCAQGVFRVGTVIR